MADLRYSEENKIRFKEIIRSAISDFERDHAHVGKVIVLRDGVTAIQKRHVTNTEIAFFTETLAEMGRESANLIFMTADKRVSTKIFEFNRRENKLNHLEAGI